MIKKTIASLFVAVVLSAGWVVSAHAFACKCEGASMINSGGIDWLYIKGDKCGGSFNGGSQGVIKNDISTPYHFMSSKYYSHILDGKVESDYDPDSGWRCVKRKTY